MPVTILKTKTSAKDGGSAAPDVGDTPQPFADLETATKAALAYISNGLAVLPLPSNSKQPNIKSWPCGE